MFTRCGKICIKDENGAGSSSHRAIVIVDGYNNSEADVLFEHQAPQEVLLGYCFYVDDLASVDLESSDESGHDLMETDELQLDLRRRALAAVSSVGAAPSDPQRTRGAYRAARESPEQTIVVFGSGRRFAELKGNDFLRFKEKHLFTDNILNAYGHCLCASSSSNDKTIRIFSTFFMPALFGGRVFDEVKARRGAAKVAGGCFFSLDVVLWPIHVNLEHWALLIINVQDKTVRYIDSKAYTGRGYLAMVEKFLVSVAQDQPNFLIGDWTFMEGTAETPQQRNGWDCGVFVCAAMAYVVQDGSVDLTSFSQVDIPPIRQRLASMFLDLRPTDS